MRPGCKVDTVLVLKGLQGARKSTWLKALAGDDWFSDTPLDLGNLRDCYQALQGVWLYELAELDSIRGRKATTVKALISSPKDRFRRSYGRNIETVERGGVITGTTNDQAILTDGTGSRRFWPVEVGKMDVEAVKRDRDQLWAEAVHLYNAGEQWWLSDDGEAERQEAADAYQEVDAWLAPIDEWLVGKSSVTVHEVSVEVLKKDAPSQHDARRISDCMRAAGWLPGARKSVGGRKRRVWAPGR